VRRIDTHHHVIPPSFRAWTADRGLGVHGGVISAWPQWTAEEGLAMMDTIGVQTGVASVPLPGHWFRDEAEAAKVVPPINDFLAELTRGNPDRYGFFAYLPLPYVDLALAEAERALDELGADGVMLMARAGDRYLGDPEFEPLFAELGRRGTVVFTHPAELPGQTPDGVIAGLTDFLLDTTRAGVRLVMSGTMRRHPDLKVILPHGGGFLPYVASRARGVLPPFAPPAGPDAPTTVEELDADLRRFYFDTALPPSPYGTPSLLAFADHTHLLFGTDYAIAPPPMVQMVTDTYDADPYLDAPLRAAIDHDNALALFPRLKH
jgi:predicted TIM-barrel fold metal-dependent hydrolase